MKKIWIVKEVPSKDIEKITSLTGFSEITAKILISRGIKDKDDIESFFNPDFRFFKDPNRFKDIVKAANRIYEACINKEKITIYGDYDADGITSTAILYEFLNISGADVSFYIPDRRKDGYGLKPEFIEKTDAELIITVDNGISSFDAVESANNKGIDVIITDHHDVPEKIPNAYAVIDPKQKDCDSGMGYLAGVGVTYCLIIVLRQEFRKKDFYKNRIEPNLKDMCDLVAIGTVADLVPMINENRILVKTGFEILAATKRPGLKALLKMCNLNGQVKNSEDIGFKIAPKINAPGRMDNANICVELLLSNELVKAEDIAKQLIVFNLERKNLEKSTEIDILEILEKEYNSENSVIVLSSPDWDSGVLGIVASKIASKYHKPVVLFEEFGEVSKGSGRSVDGINMCEGFNYARDAIMMFGGHEMAAGLSLETSKIDTFRKLFNEYADKFFKSGEIQPKIQVDSGVTFDQIDEKLMDELDMIEPCGSMNSFPVFKSDNVEIVNIKTVGGSHKKITLKQNLGEKTRIFDAILFNNQELDENIKSLNSIVFSPRWNYWNGSRNIQIVIEDYRL